MHLTGKSAVMKKNFVSLSVCILAVFAWSCGNSSNTSTSTDTTSTTTSTTTDTSHANAPTTTNPSTTASSTPLSKDDSEFVMKAAVGGMEEVQLGQVAQQNAMNQRVKDFGSMMNDDHSKANDQLKSLVSSKGITLPAALPSDKQKDVDKAKGMTGKSFDQHYVSMMVSDHKKDIDDFKKQLNKAKDPDLKTWIGNTLPVLQKHLDSINAIKKDLHY